MARFKDKRGKLVYETQHIFAYHFNHQQAETIKRNHSASEITFSTKPPTIEAQVQFFQAENPQYANIITKNLYDDLIGNIALQLFNPFKSIQSIKKWLTTEINSIFWHDISKRLSPQINLNDINMLISHGKQRLKAERKNYFIYLITSIFKQ